MIIKENIKDVTIANTRISKILSGGGGGIIWEKEKVYKIVWSKVGSTDSDDKRYNSSIYTSFKIDKGKIIPGEKDALWGGLRYYIDTSRNTIKKFKNTGSTTEKIDSESYRTILIYDIYDGTIIEEYR